jgi:hypothetical protein
MLHERQQVLINCIKKVLSHFKMYLTFMKNWAFDAVETDYWTDGWTDGLTDGNIREIYEVV